MRQTADTLISEREEDFLEWDWSQLIHILCCAATTTMGVFAIVEDLNTASTKTSVTEERPIDNLAAAAYTGRIAKVRSMIEEGIHKSAKSNYFGSPLEAAASGGHTPIVLMLLENDFDVLTRLVPAIPTSCHSSFYDEFNTALKAASTAGHENIVRLLLDSKYRSKSSQSGYHHAACGAARMGHAGIVRFLLDRIEIAMRRLLQRAILLTASEHGHEVIVQWML